MNSFYLFIFYSVIQAIHFQHPVTLPSKSKWKLQVGRPRPLLYFFLTMKLFFQSIISYCTFLKLHSILIPQHWAVSTSRCLGAPKLFLDTSSPFCPPLSVISGHINTPVKFSHVFCLYTPPRPLKALAQQYLLSLSSLSAQLSSFFWHSSRILCDVPYLSFLEPVCNKSFIFILFSECSTHYHVGIILKDPTKVTCSFTI